MTTQYANGPDGKLWIVTDSETYTEFVALMDHLGITAEES